jgi:hypothetical protein
MEVLARDEAERASVRFFLPAAAAVYTIPYFVAERGAALGKASPVFLWSFCSTAAGLLVLVMVLGLYWSSDGTRKIGTYIKESLEPRTCDGLRWESAVFAFSEASGKWPNETFVVSAGAVAANLLAAGAVSATFLSSVGGWRQYTPLWLASVLAIVSGPSLWALMRPRTLRKKHANTLSQAELVQRKAG